MQTQLPNKVSIDTIIKNAFGYWKETILYQVLFSLITFCILFIVAVRLGTQYGILQEYTRIFSQHSGNISAMQKEVQKLMLNPNFEKLSLIFLAVKVFLFPLELGLFKIYRKIDLKEKYGISDLFGGYTGISFFIFIGYYLFWYFIYSYSMVTLILPAIWVICTIFVAPLMFFMHQPMFKAIGINLKVLKIYFTPIFLCGIIALLFKYSGFLLFGVGILFTYPFSSAMIYALYQTIFKEEIRKI